MIRVVECPRCHGPMDSRSALCQPCNSSRSRRFCPYCGRVIDLRAFTCREHRDLPALDWRYTDGLESLPMHADELAATPLGSPIALRASAGTKVRPPSGALPPSGEEVPATREPGA